MIVTKEGYLMLTANMPEALASAQIANARYHEK